MTTTRRKILQWLGFGAASAVMPALPLAAVEEQVITRVIQDAPMAEPVGYSLLNIGHPTAMVLEPGDYITYNDRLYQVLCNCVSYVEGAWGRALLTTVEVDELEGHFCMMAFTDKDLVAFDELAEAEVSFGDVNNGGKHDGS